MAIVYKHTRNDTNEIFYIGIGTFKKRMFEKIGRNIYWHNIVKKYGYDTEIIRENLSWEIACKEEIRLIKKYGRKDLGLGNLVNMTNGGEGIPGVIRSEQTCKKISESLKGHVVSDISRKKMSEAGKDKIFSKETLLKLSNANKGLIRSDETKRKMSIAKQNPTNITRMRLSKAMKGKKHKITTCSKCGKIGGVNGLTRYHFDNCKLKITQII